MQKRKRTFLKLRGLLAENDMTIEELGFRIGRSRPYMNKCFCGGSSWQLSEMYAILDYFYIPHDQLHVYFPKDGISA